MPTLNAITIARACRACLASLGGLALVILSPSLADADFGPRTTIGKNYQQWSDARSADGINPGNCSNDSGCFVLFQPIPQQQPLMVQHVACWASVSAGGLTSVFLGTRKGQTFVGRYTQLVPIATTGGQWAINSPAMHLFKSGERPYVLFLNSAAATWGVDCSISGRLQ